MVESQIFSLTPDPSFGHKLFFKCLNEQFEPILDIYIPRAFQWYKELFKKLNFDPWNRPLKIWEFVGTPTPKVELPWECEGSFLHILLHSREHAEWLLGFLLALNLATPFALVASPRLGLRQIRRFVPTMWLVMSGMCLIQEKVHSLEDAKFLLEKKWPNTTSIIFKSWYGHRIWRDTTSKSHAHPTSHFGKEVHKVVPSLDHNGQLY
jgi:hypothetical protein